MGFQKYAGTVFGTLVLAGFGMYVAIKEGLFGDFKGKVDEEQKIVKEVVVEKLPSDLEKYLKKFDKDFGRVEKLIAAYEKLEQDKDDEILDYSTSGSHIYIDDDLIEVNSLTNAEIRLWKEGELYVFDFYHCEQHITGEGRKKMSAREVGTLAIAAVKDVLDSRKVKRHFPHYVVPELLKMGEYKDWRSVTDKDGNPVKKTYGNLEITANKIMQYIDDNIKKETKTEDKKEDSNKPAPEGLEEDVYKFK